MKKRLNFRKREYNFFKYYRESWKYIKEIRKYIYLIIGFFFFSALLGFVFASRLSFIEPILKEIVAKTDGLGWGQLIWFILKNNAESALFGLIFGIVLGIFPILNAFANGLILGYVLNRVWAVSGILEFWRLFPHGIFELPAIFLSLAMGLHFGGFIFSKNKVDELGRRFYSSMKVFVFVVLPLLIIAAIIEGTLIHLLK